MSNKQKESLTQECTSAAEIQGEKEITLYKVDENMCKVDLKGKVKVDHQTITFEVPNHRGLTLEQVDRALASGNFCAGCHGVLTTIGDFLW